MVKLRETGAVFVNEIANLSNLISIFGNNVGLMSKEEILMISCILQKVKVIYPLSLLDIVWLTSLPLAHSQKFIDTRFCLK